MIGRQAPRAARLLVSFILVLTALGLTTSLAGASAEIVGAVYTMTNAPGGNEVLIFARGTDGSLTAAGSVATGGAGTGAGLGSQGALTLRDDGRWLFAVNAGSDEISSLRVKPMGLNLSDTVDSGGDMPISVTVHRDLVYVLNAGGIGNITGFRVGEFGRLAPIAGSTQPLSGNAVGPAQISFSPDGTMLVVAEKATNLIGVYHVGSDGVASGPTTYPSSGATPFGFAFDARGRIFVSEAFGGATDASALSSYKFLNDGTLQVISPSVSTTETAACWVAVTKDGRYAYVANAGSASISGYKINFDGSLTLLDADGVTGMTGASPIDTALNGNSKYLYTLNSGSHTISAFRVGVDGHLTALDGASGLPAGSVGLAAT